jgi:predicted helicase
LKIDFPRVPFTSNNEIFKQMSVLGKELADLHLMKSDSLNQPVAKYQGEGDNDKIEKPVYQEKQNRLYINKDKYFEGIKPEVMNYYIGGYKVLEKYINYRKGRSMDNPVFFCKIVTALEDTIKIQHNIDQLYNKIEARIVDFIT